MLLSNDLIGRILGYFCYNQPVRYKKFIVLCMLLKNTASVQFGEICKYMLSDAIITLKMINVVISHDDSQFYEFIKQNVNKHIYASAVAVHMKGYDRDLFLLSVTECITYRRKINLTQLESYLDYDITTIDMDDYNAKSLLLFACLANNAVSIDVAKLLLKKGVDVNKEGHGTTPLICACRTNNEHIIDLLIQAGANLDKQDSSGDTALMNACIHCDSRVVKKLIDAGCNIHLKNRIGQNALYFATNLCADSENLLLKAGAVSIFNR
jgi:ankyrin repeat protein